MDTKLARSGRTWLGAGIVVIALVLAGCGSSPPASGSKAPSSTPSSSGSSSGGSSSGGSSSGGASASGGIPQGANAGDGDSDNHGGPSDGDGNL